MATVEHIYRKIRRGDTADFKAVVHDDAELEAGVHRIRNRLAATGALEKNQRSEKSNLITRPWLWVSGGVVSAAAAALLVLYLPTKQMSKPHTHWTIAGKNASLHEDLVLPAGTELNSENKFIVRAITACRLRIFSGEGTMHTVTISSGETMVERRDNRFAVTVKTHLHSYVLTGTKFFLRTSTHEDFIYMFEGSLTFAAATGEQHIMAVGPNSLRATVTGNEIHKMEETELAARIKALSAIALPPRTAAAGARPTAQARQNASRKLGECVYYYRNNEKRRGKIHAHDEAGYLILGSAGPEPGRWREGDLYSAECPPE